MEDTEHTLFPALQNWWPGRGKGPFSSLLPPGRFVYLTPVRNSFLPSPSGASSHAKVRLYLLIHPNHQHRTLLSGLPPQSLLFPSFLCSPLCTGVWGFFWAGFFFGIFFCGFPSIPPSPLPPRAVELTPGCLNSPIISIPSRLRFAVQTLCWYKE